MGRKGREGGWVGGWGVTESSDEELEEGEGRRVGGCG